MSGADEDELFGASTEQLEIALNVGGSESNPVNDCVIRFVLELLNSGGIVYIRDHCLCLHSGRKLRRMLAAAQQGYVHATLGGEHGAGRADDSGSTNEENFHRHYL